MSALAILGSCLYAAAALTAEPTPRHAAREFTSEIALLFRAAACGRFEGEGPPAPFSAPIDPKVIEAHCKALEPLIVDYSEFWQKAIEPTIVQIVPRSLANTVVYPFGGGDLITALGTYSEAREITTLSLELTGDPRGLGALPPDRLRSELATARSNLEKLYRVKHSRTDNLGAMTAQGVTGELVFALTALRVRGAEPVSLRYFSLTPEGAIDYLSSEEVAQIDRDLADKKIDQRQAAWAFANAEIEFRKVGDRQLRVFRHIAANLDNEHVAKNPGPLKHLEQKGRVMAITKAASYLLWWENFSAVRDYLVKNIDFMISDSTGIPPDVAAAAGFKQYTFGEFTGPYLTGANGRVASLFREMWHKQQRREMGFRYGYPDVNKNAHMLVTTKLDWSEPKLIVAH